MNRDRRAIRPLLLLVALTAWCSFATASQSFAGKPANGVGSYTLVENARLVSPGNTSQSGAETTSTADPFTWGAVDLPIPVGLRLRDLTRLSTDYKFIWGSCWGGSPRFEAWFVHGTSKGKIFFYIGPPPSWTGCPSGEYANSGNLATPSSTVDAGQLGASPPYQAYSNVQARYGNYAITHVYLDTDGGWYSDQTVDFDNTWVNGNLVTYDG